MRNRFSPSRGYLARLLRVLSSVCLVLLALAIFRRPLALVLEPRLLPAVQQLGIPRLFSPAAAKGFMVRVVSVPSGAKVLVDGADRGATPLFANVVCEEGQKVAIEVEKAGYPRWRRTVPCRVGGELTARARLGE